MIDLFKGWPSPDLLPADLLLRVCQRVLTDPKLFVPSLLYGPDPGYQPLREAIAAWLSDYYSFPHASADRICISGGASQNLACILQVYTDPSYTRNIYMVAPTYHLVCRIFEDNGFAGALRAVPEDCEGVDIEYLERCLAANEEKAELMPNLQFKRPQLAQKLYRYVIYAVPTFSNPSGKTMSLCRRRQLVRLARQYDALIIADDVYDFLRWSSDQNIAPVLPRLVDVDSVLDGGPSSPFGNVVSNGSFSKILGPGVRTGWAEATSLFIDGLSCCGSTVSGGAPSQLVASFIAEALSDGSLTLHLKQILIPALQKRSSLVLTAVRQLLTPCGVSLDTRNSGKQSLSNIQGGYYIYVLLPPPLQASSVATRAWEEEEVVVAGGEIFEVWGDEGARPCQQNLRICFAWENEELLLRGLEKLAKVIRGMLKE